MQIYSRFLIKRSVLWVKIYGKPKFVIIVLEEFFGKMQIYECFFLDNCINTRFLCWKNAESHVGNKNIALH